MNTIEKHNLHDKEKKLRILEHESIKEKAKFIMTHSNALLERIEKGDEAFLNSFVAFLISNTTDDFEMSYTTNEYDYEESLDVIFKVCSFLPSLGLNPEECANIRNKIRLYTKYFKVSYEAEKKVNCKYISLDLNKCQHIIKNR